MSRKARNELTLLKNGSFEELVGEENADRARLMFECGRSAKYAAHMLKVPKANVTVAFQILKNETEDVMVPEIPDSEEDAASMATLDLAPQVAKAVQLAKQQHLARVKHGYKPLSKRSPLTFGFNENDYRGLKHR